MAAEHRGRAVEFPLESALGRIAKAGLATVSEILDPEGPWDQDLIALMLPVAIELEADQAEATFGAVAAAASSLFSKEGAEAFRAGLQRVRAEVRHAQEGARVEERGADEAREPRASRADASQVPDSTAEAMLGILGKMGLRVTRPRPRSGLRNR